MRAFPLLVIASLFCWLAPALVWAQEIHCDPCYHALGEVQIGTSSSYSIAISNPGNKTLRITSKSIQGSEFKFGNFPLPVNVQPGGSVNLEVIFTPTAKGYAHATLTLVSNAPNSPLNMHTHGTGIYPASAELAIAPATLSFGDVTVGSSASLQATLTASNAAVTISSDRSNSSEFAILGLNLPVTLAAGQSVAVTVQFTPSASGTAHSKVGFVSNAIDSPTVEPVTGTGEAQTAHNVYLSWDADGTAVGYNVYRGNSKSGPFKEINNVLDASTNYTDYTVVGGDTYYYVTTEVNAQGQESGYSNVAEAVVPSQ
ncbi:MAG: choice-of-anchor D domain-containing protein [Terriglobales bacterium]